MKKFLAITLLFLQIQLITFSQCPMCKQNVEAARKNKGTESRIVGSGLNEGILFLLSMPYIMITSMGLIWYTNHRKKKKLLASSSLDN